MEVVMAYFKKSAPDVCINYQCSLCVVWVSKY